MQPLNMHGDAATWEEELLATVRERDTARAEAGECRSEAIANKVQLLEARAEVERLRAVAWEQGNRADELETEVEQLRATVRAARELVAYWREWRPKDVQPQSHPNWDALVAAVDALGSDF